MTRMGCWKWFSRVLDEAGIEVTDENAEKIDEIIHEYVSERAAYGRCSPDWSKARKKIQANEEMKQELIARLRSLA